MKNIWAWTKLWAQILLRFAAYIVGIALAFKFIFQFSNLQAAGLGLTLALAIDIAASRKTQKSFRPYLVRVYPKLWEMLIDLGLATDEQLKSVVKEAPPFRPWTDDHIFHYGIRAFIISHDPEAIERRHSFP